jgi:surfeit locus 1 family protein
VSRKIFAFAALAVALAALFIWLGFWQLDRRVERRAANGVVRTRLAMPTTPFSELARARPSFDSAMDTDSSNRPWDRRATVTGVPDHDNEFVVTGRSRNGSPGVHIFTPIKVQGDDRVVLVNRGWVYAPDAATVDLSRWREGRRTFSGYTVQMPTGDIRSNVKGRGLRPLLFTGVRRLLPYGFHGLYIVSLDSATDTTPVRLPAPDLNDGPHLSYAIQWFCFAAIALVGAGIVVARSFKGRGAGATGA